MCQIIFRKRKANIEEQEETKLKKFHFLDKYLLWLSRVELQKVITISFCDTLCNYCNLSRHHLLCALQLLESPKHFLKKKFNVNQPFLSFGMF